MTTSMDFTSFTQTILQNVQKDLGKNYTVYLKNIQKNNGVKKTGVIIKKEGQTIYPAIYIDDLYQKNMTMDDIKIISDNLLENFQSTQLNEEVDLSGFVAFEQASKRIAYKLISGERNRELLRQIPHKRYYNLAMVFYYTLQEPPFYGRAAILIQNYHMEQWRSNPENLFELAFSNTPKLFPWVIGSIESIMQEIFAESLGRKDTAGGSLPESLADEDKEKIPMYVLTNRQQLYGAACMLYPGVLGGFADRIGKDLYILPSSVHEVILVPADDNVDKEAFREIVTDINRTQVAADEVLADSVYYYSRKKDKILLLL